ncbi:MAG TPA: hypothetical protein VF587_07415, partial [Solirubrobacteraceae bacterium]
AITPGVLAGDGGYRLAEGAATPNFGDALLDVAQVIVSLSPEGAPFSSLGETVRLIVRVLGPVLLGLTLLSLRGRVKR